MEEFMAAMGTDIPKPSTENASHAAAEPILDSQKSENFASEKITKLSLRRRGFVDPSQLSTGMERDQGSDEHNERIERVASKLTRVLSARRNN